MKNVAQVERNLNGGVQKVFVFPNGYGASVVRHNFSYGGDRGLWELAVLEMNGTNDPLDFVLTYDTEIAGDVLGFLTDEKVEETLEMIKALDERWQSA